MEEIKEELSEMHKTMERQRMEYEKKISELEEKLKAVGGGTSADSNNKSENKKDAEKPKEKKVSKLEAELAAFTQFQRDALQAHNNYRAKHGAVPLKLDKELCSFADEWARHLAPSGQLRHRQNSGKGENIYSCWGKASVTGSEPVDSWYSEIKDYRFGSGGFAMNTGHFTQVVWRNTEKLGIAMAQNSSGQIMVVANYLPPGNYQGQFQQNVLPLGTAPPPQPKDSESESEEESPSTKESTKQDEEKTKKKTVEAGSVDDTNFSEWQRQALKAHNDYRAKHGVPPLKLTKELCSFSDEWARHLAPSGQLRHRQNSGKGENIYSCWGKASVTGSEPVDSWYSEIKNYRFGSGGFAMNTGHFTQVVWRDTRELGIAMARNRSGQIMVVANYLPPGNYQGRFAQNVPPLCR